MDSQRRSLKSAKTSRKRGKGLSLSVLLKRAAAIVFGNAKPNSPNNNEPPVFTSPKRTLTRSFKPQQNRRTRRRNGSRY